MTAVPAWSPTWGDAVWGTDKAELAASLVRRRAATLRCPPLADGRRDPLCWPPTANQESPAGTGLELRELLREADRLKRMGWHQWELEARFGQLRREGSRR